MEKTYRSDAKEVREKVRSHIHDYYDFEDLISDVEALQFGYHTSPYQAAKRLVEYGGFLAYYSDVREFLESLNLNNKSNKTFTNEDCWKMYTHLLAREIERIYKIKKGV